MRLLFIILGLISGILALILAILPFGLIALVPAVLALIFGLLAFIMSKKDGKSKLPVKIIFLFTILALVLTTYKSVTSENTIESDTEFIEKQEDSQQEALEELEELNIEESQSE